jgi:hypothetical protein
MHTYDNTFVHIYINTNIYVYKLDGEHPNERGTFLESKIIANVMLNWFQTHDHWNLISK